ncbi:MAG: hypothetical protein JSV91_05955 [Phycisphaerales bacterium]|nr:MAG: hypothetical protein JSV91_05955 [Phycisphaerales bacterium]
MEDDRRGDPHGGCPHVDRNDPRCNSRFSLGRLDQAFCVCLGAFHACPMYHQINADLSAAGTGAVAEIPLPVVGVTIGGLDAALRATGS